jgi:hypothetical protein
MKKLLIGLVAVFAIAGCQKVDHEDPILPVIQSSEKNISEVVFKKTDNPSLSGDIVATIIGDSVKAVFSKSFSLNNLVPTINFSGKSISPASKTPQNFSNPVTYTVTAEDGSTLKFIVAASNRQMSDSQFTLNSKWKLLRDSLSNINFFFYEGGNWWYPGPGVYYGTASDYYDFKDDGKVNLYANQQAYTTPFQLLSNNKLSFSESDPIYDPATIVTLTEKELVFFWTKESTYNGGGHYYRKVYLYK